MDRKKLIKHLINLILSIFVINFLASKFYWYSSIWCFDMIVHFLGGLWVGLAVIYFFPPKSDSINAVLRILLLVFFIGVGWEVFELLVNDVIAKNLFNYLDTTSDIFFDLSGGAFAVLYFLKRIIFIKENAI